MVNLRFINCVSFAPNNIDAIIELENPSDIGKTIIARGNEDFLNVYCCEGMGYVLVDRIIFCFKLDE